AGRRGPREGGDQLRRRRRSRMDRRDRQRHAQRRRERNQTGRGMIAESGHASLFSGDYSGVRGLALALFSVNYSGAKRKVGRRAVPRGGLTIRSRRVDLRWAETVG